MRKLILITLLLSISNVLFSQKINAECDSSVYLMVNQMPLYRGNYNAIMDNISRQIDNETKSILQNNNTNIIFQITCNGKITISEENSALMQFYTILENELNKLQWIPANQNGINVTIQSILRVKFVNGKFNILIGVKEFKGELVKVIVSDEKSNIPISDVRLITKYNNSSYFSNQNGELEFYCDPKDEIEVNHINYPSFSFNAPENANSLQIRLLNIVYELETVDLTKNSPKKLPHKKSICNFEDWQEKKQNKFVILGLGDFCAPEMAVFNGGYECLYNYIAQEFELPKSAFENEYIDTVDVSFTIAEDGTIRNATLSKQLNYGIDTSLIKMFHEMPKWRPATQARKKIEQKFVIKLIIGVNKYWEKNYGQNLDSH